MSTDAVPTTAPPRQTHQRITTTENRDDFTQHTWISLLGMLQPREFFVTINNFHDWRRHLAWAKQDGGDLRQHMMQRFSSSMVFMSLLLGSEIGVLLNSAHITTQIRKNLREHNHGNIEFWIGIVIIFSVMLTLLTLITTFTVWDMVSSVSDKNANAILRSSIGQFVAHLPANLIAASIYSFLLWVVMFLFILLPGLWSFAIVVPFCALFFYVVTVISAFGRVIMHSGAMGTDRIFDSEFEKELLPHGLHTSLVWIATKNLRQNKSIRSQYKTKYAMRLPPAGVLNAANHRSESIQRLPSYSEPSYSDSEWADDDDSFGERVIETTLPLTGGRHRVKREKYTPQNAVSDLSGSSLDLASAALLPLHGINRAEEYHSPSSIGLAAPSRLPRNCESIESINRERGKAQTTNNPVQNDMEPTCTGRDDGNRPSRRKGTENVTHHSERSVSFSDNMAQFAPSSVNERQHLLSGIGERLATYWTRNDSPQMQPNLLRPSASIVTSNRALGSDKSRDHSSDPGQNT